MVEKENEYHRTYTDRVVGRYERHAELSLITEEGEDRCNKCAVIYAE